MAETQYKPGTYVRGSETRTARTPAQAVQAVWEGFSRASEQVTDDVDYRDLQAQAKALNIPANQSKEALAEAIANHEPDPTPTDGESADGDDQ